MELLLKNALRLTLVFSSYAVFKVSGNSCAPCHCCTDDGWTMFEIPCVECIDMDLTSVPVFSLCLTKIIKTLIIDHNRIGILESGAFKDYSNLVELLLYHNEISNLSRNWFRDLEKLTSITLIRNDIKVIESHTFQHAKSLRYLSLSSNKIDVISEDSWYGLENLTYLGLSGNNIRSLKRGTFRGLGSLRSLWLSSNKIARLSNDSFAGLGNVRTLYLTKNNLQTLEHNTFSFLPSLKHLYLAKNNISSIERETFIHSRNLQKLYLNNNNLKQIPDALWTPHSSSVELYIANNPFECSCSCGFLNKVKQLQAALKKLTPTSSDFEKQCTNTTSVCEEERNFAFGMNFTYNCTISGFHSGYAVTNNKSKMSGWCPFSTCWRYLSIDLPGVIVVTKAIINMTSLQQYERNYMIIVNVKVKNEQYSTSSQCGTFVLPPGTSAVAISCTKTCIGRTVVIDITPNHNYIVSQSHCVVTANDFEAIGRNQVQVHSYEENKYNIWSSWNQWGRCNKLCGYGTRIRNRSCTKPTSLKCLISRLDIRRSSIHQEKESCIIIPCSLAVYYWSIGGVAGFFVLIIFGIIFWYRKFKMVTYFDGLRPNPNFQLDPNRTLLEQIEELSYNLHWEFPRYDVRLGSILGEGNFGRVWHAKAKGIKAFNPRDKSDLSSRAKLAKLQDQRVHEHFTTITETWVLGDCDTTHHYDVAVKTLKESATPKHKMDLASELKLLIYMDRHPNIVNVLAACTIRGDLWVIMEFCDHGCLKQFLSDLCKMFSSSWSKESVDITSSLCLFDLLQMSEQIIRGVMFLHCWNVVHRDLSARNILVDSNFNLKIADFGLARSNNFAASVDDIMPIKWTSLESLLRHEYTTKSDIWSVGVLLWEIFSLGEMPYPGMASREVVQQLKVGYRMEPPTHCPDEIWKIISDCWHVDPEQRPNASEIFGQLDEIKLSICSAPDGQYYGTDVDFQHAGTVQGPSLHKIMEINDQFESSSEISSSDVGMQESGPSTIVNEVYRHVEAASVKLQQKIGLVEGVVDALNNQNDDRIEKIQHISSIALKDGDGIKECMQIDHMETVNGKSVGYDDDHHMEEVELGQIPAV